MSSTDPAEAPSAAVRAQILATEHWSLLGTRSTLWAEVMSRITIHLTVASAALVVLALVAQTSGFGAPFRLLSIGLASVILVLGTLTGVRVMNASHDDSALILGMNRIRSAYVALDPGIAEYLVTSWEGSRAGLMQTYTMGLQRSTVSHVVGSTAMFVNVVNSIVAGTLGALVARAAGSGPAAIAIIGALSAALYLGAWLEYGRRSFRDRDENA
jgi:hypothetical protein